MTSASPSATSRAASPMACAPVEQAVTTAWLGPLRPCAIDTYPDARLISRPGMKNGETRRGPLSFSTTAVSAMPVRPPIPEPIITPVLICSSRVVGFQAASSSAWCAAHMAKTMKSSTLRCSFGSIHWSGLKLPFEPSPRGTWQAILAGRSDTSKDSIRLAPLSPLTSRCHVGSTPQASGVTMPSPVTTTRLIFDSIERVRSKWKPPLRQNALGRNAARAAERSRRSACRRTPPSSISYSPGTTECQGQSPIAQCARIRRKWRSSALRVLLEELDGVADRQDGLGGIVGDLAAELFLERHDEFNRVEAVSTEIIDEAGVLDHLLGFDAQMLHDDLFHPLANVTHRCNLVSL